MTKIELRPLPQQEFLAWQRESLESYAAEKVAAGNWSADEAADKSKKAFADLLPMGPETKDHYMGSFWCPESEKSVGIVWFHLVPGKQQSAFIYDFVIYPEFRGKGLAKAALHVAETEMKRLGAKSSRLHVFAHNKIARKLYETTGYEVTNLNMCKSF